MEEPARYKKDSMKHARIPYMLVLRRYGGSLAAISATWYVQVDGFTERTGHLLI